MEYNEFDKLIKNCKNQFIIKTSDNKTYFLALNKTLHYNGVGFLATNENTSDIDILTYEDIDYLIVDGEKVFWEK